MGRKNKNKNKTKQEGEEEPEATTPTPTPTPPPTPTQQNGLLGNVLCVVRVCLCLYFLWMAVDFRLHAVRNYGRVIHEFDPWFNYRATEKLVAVGYSDFVNWYDYESWYPIGRPVGKTVYPGLMWTSATIYHVSQFLGFDISVNDICVFVPAIFSVVSCSFLYLFAYIITLNHNVATAAMGLFAIIPAHLMRSVAGGYDNESVAVSLIVATFFFWVYSLRYPAWWKGIVTGIFYTYMVATWGAYTFVLNLIAGHCLGLLFVGQFTWDLYYAYVGFFVVGTCGALQFPIVGNQPFDSMEQISGLVAFALINCYAIFYYLEKNHKLGKVFLAVLMAVCATATAYLLHEGLERGFLLPATARVRSLFVEHTKTGNPLVDSVAEHQSTNMDTYGTFFGDSLYAALAGVALSPFVLGFNSIPTTTFFWLYFGFSGYFSFKMVRLVLLFAPTVAVGAGMLVGWSFDFCVAMLFNYWTTPVTKAEHRRMKKAKGVLARTRNFLYSKWLALNQYSLFILLKWALALCILYALYTQAVTFHSHCEEMAPHLSEPQIILHGRTQNGEKMVVDDYREAYHWLRDNTPEDSRVLAWWDYGYQINGIANRTTIADGNTWNHEHIALLGRCLISPERKAHRIIRHLADYVLIWSSRWVGIYGDDLAKCPHMARIASSVFFDIDHTKYYMTGPDSASPALSKSLLYNLHGYRYNPRIQKPKYFEEAYTTQNAMVRIWKVKNVAQDSKKFVAANHTYPPALDEVLSKSNSFKREREELYLNLH